MSEFSADAEAIRRGEEKSLAGADLRYADLRDADLWRANLRDADLRDADLRDADLRDADLWRADLRDADLWRANLRDVKIDPHMVVPESGEATVWKAAQDHLVKCEVPADAERITALGSRKCRASALDVVEIIAPDGTPCEATEAAGRHDGETIYPEGERVHPDEFDADERVECSHGLHFFATKREAAEWGCWELVHGGDGDVSVEVDGR